MTKEAYIPPSPAVLTTTARRIVALPLAVLALSLASCGKEDTPQADFQNPTAHFLPAADDQSPEATLRRAFHAETGTYLLFNDTLQNRLLGRDVNGDLQYFNETIDFGYNIGQSQASATDYTFAYLLTSEEQEQMVQYVKDYIFAHVSGKMRPYSVFLANTITGYNRNGVGNVRPYAVANQRCLGIACNYLLLRERTEAQKQAFATRVLNVMVTQQANNNTQAFTQFYAYSGSFYSQSLYNLGLEKSVQTFRERGFISSPADDFPMQSTDLSAFVTEVLQNTEEQLQAKYGTYPLVMQKLAEVRRVLQSLGYVF